MFQVWLAWIFPESIPGRLMGLRVGKKQLVNLTQVLIRQRSANLCMKPIVDQTANLCCCTREGREGWQFPMLAHHFFKGNIDQISQIILAERRFSHCLFHSCLCLRSVGTDTQMSTNDAQMAATCSRSIVPDEITSRHCQTYLLGNVVNHSHGNRRQRNCIAQALERLEQGQESYLSNIACGMLSCQLAFIRRWRIDFSQLPISDYGLETR